MKKKLLLVGSGGFGRVALEHAIGKYECSFVDDGYDVGTEICGVKVIGHTCALKMLFGEYKLLICTIGNNSFREKIYIEAKEIGYLFPNIIANNVYISPFAKVGCGCVFLNNVVIQNGTHVGNGVVLNPGVEIHHDSTVGDNCLIYTNSVVRAMAKLGERVKLGSNVTISNNAQVADGTVIDDGVAIIK